MEQKEFQNLVKEEKVEFIKPPEFQTPEQKKFKSNADLFNVLRSLKRNLTNDPTGANTPPDPMGFLDQFQLFGDALHMFVPRADGTKAAGSWVKIEGSSPQFAVGSGIQNSHPASPHTTDVNVGFDAEAVIMFAYSTATASIWSAGFSAGVLNTAYAITHRDDSNIENANSVVMRLINAAHTIYVTAALEKITNGFQLTWSWDGATGYYPVRFIYLAFGKS